MLSNAFSLILLAAATLASPLVASSETPAVTKSAGGERAFGLQAFRPGSAIHQAPFQAALNSVFLNLPAQNATCQRDTNTATFILEPPGKGALYLYNSDALSQQLYVDRSGMGQGKFGWTTGDSRGPRYSERVSFSVDSYDFLTFRGHKFIACPNGFEGAWSVWLDVGILNPGFNQGCEPIEVQAIPTGDPDSCVYAQSQ
ncbi:hypothetical protein GGR50DRAFT_87362 [Xylaria sp. CBS 124048]|nr:hypothetical protein GGR50DRAFT_87362 [Xylaria sp. CBS 124048]